MTSIKTATFVRMLLVPAASLGLALSIAGCCKSGGDEKPCPSSYKMLSPNEKAEEATCKCAAADTTGGSVWGSDIYTTDSSICRAAVHAGVITTSGGMVTVKSAKGCSSYEGAKKNGISSSKWGSFGSSFYFPGKGDGKCSAKVSKPAAGKKCPRNFKSIPGRNDSTRITCSCDPSMTNQGPVWGSDIYTQDSSICRAAVHAGAIPSSGGTVTAKAASGCKKYKAKTRNGVKSGSWGSYDASFYFPSKGNGACL